jgi:hypothetical protein
MTRQEKIGADGDEKSREVPPSVAKAAGQITARELFQRVPTAWLDLAKEELAAPPKTPEDAAERAGRWRLYHLFHLGITPSEADMEAAYGPTTILGAADVEALHHETPSPAPGPANLPPAAEG